MARRKINQTTKLMSKLNDLLFFLEGKKTYIVGVVGALFNILMAFGIVAVSPEQFIAIDGLMIALFGLTFRSALNK